MMTTTRFDEDGIDMIIANAGETKLIFLGNGHGIGYEIMPMSKVLKIAQSPPETPTPLGKGTGTPLPDPTPRRLLCLDSA